MSEAFVSLRCIALPIYCDKTEGVIATPQPKGLKSNTRNNFTLCSFLFEILLRTTNNSNVSKAQERTPRSANRFLQSLNAVSEAMIVAIDDIPFNRYQMH